MSQRPDSVPHRPEGVSQRPGSVPQRPDILRFWQDIQDISGYPGGVTARLRRALAPCRSSPGGLAQSARGRWLNAKEGGDVATGRRAPFKCQHQQRGRGERSADRSTRTAPRVVNEFSEYHLLLNVSGVESVSLTLEGRKDGYFPWRCSTVFAAFFLPTLPRFCSDYPDSRPILHQTSLPHGCFRRIGTVLTKKMASADIRGGWNSGGGAGRMGEVGPPASGLSFFTVSYSRRGHSTRILLCEAADYRQQETKCEVDDGGKQANHA
ncbi:hypothetical protein CDEN61S_00025 [Castellaniella denitrificans]